MTSGDDTDLRKWLTHRVETLLAERGWTKAQAARHIDFDPNNFRNILSGHTNASTQRWDRMLHGLGIPLIPGEAEPEPEPPPPKVHAPLRRVEIQHELPRYFLRGDADQRGMAQE